jgi:hypothetical protein
MKPNNYKLLAAFAITALGLTLTGCQQAPPTAAAAAAPAAAPSQAAPAAAPSSTTESSSSRSVEVKSDPSNPDAPAGVVVKKESTTVKQQSQQ